MSASEAIETGLSEVQDGRSIPQAEVRTRLRELLRRASDERLPDKGDVLDRSPEKSPELSFLDIWGDGIRAFSAVTNDPKTDLSVEAQVA